MIKTGPIFFFGGNTVVKGPTNRVDGELVLAPSGSGQITLTTKGFTHNGVFKVGSPSIFIGDGVFADDNTPFLVGSSSIGPVFSIGRKIYAQPSGSKYVVVVSGTLLVETAPDQFSDVRDVIANSASISGLYVIEAATNALLSSSLNLAYSSSLMTASLTSVSASLAQQIATTASFTSISASLAQFTVATSASLASQAISFSASLAQKEVVDFLAVTASITSISSSIVQRFAAADASLTASITSISSSIIQTQAAISSSLASQAISFSASLASVEISHSSSFAAVITSLSASESQSDASASVVDAANKITLPTSVKTQDGLYLESSSMGFYNVAQAQYPVVINAGGQFRFADSSSYVGGADPYANVVGFANGAFLVRTDKLMLQTPSLVLIGANTASAVSNVFRLGPSATTMSFTDKLGTYLDGAGNFRVGTDTTGSEFLQFGPASGLTIKAKRLVLDAGGVYVTADTSSASSAHQLKIGVNAAGLTLTSGSGFYVDGAGNIRAGNPSTASFFEFTPSNGLRISTSKLIMDAGGLYVLAHPSSGSNNVIKLGTSANAITLATGTGIYADGGGNFRAGDPTSNFLEFTTGNALRLVTTKLEMNAGGAYILAHPSSGSANAIKLGNLASQISLSGKEGFYTDGGGNLRVGTDATGSNFLQFSTGSLIVKSQNVLLDGGGIYFLGNSGGAAASNVIKVGASAASIALGTGTGIYADGAGNFRAGDPTGNFLEFTPTNALRVVTTKMVLDAGGAYFFAHPSSGSTNAVKLGGGASTITLTNKEGFYADGGGNFKVGTDVTGSSFIQYTTANSLRIKTTKLELDAGGVYVVSHPASGSTNTLKLGVNASGLTLISGSGVYFDGGGNFRVGRGQGAGDYLLFDGSNFFLSASNFFLNAGSGGNNLQLNQLQMILGNSVSPGTWPFPYNSSTFRGLYANNQGQIFVGDAAANYFQFGGQVMEIKSNAFVLRTPGLQFSSSFSGSGGDLRAGSATSLTSGVGGFLGGDGTFRAGNPAGSQIVWNGSVLSITGSINITGGNGATQAYAISAASSSAASSSTSLITYSGSASTVTVNQSSSNAGANAVNPIGGIKTAVSPSGAGLYLGSTHLGYYNGTAWRAYLSSSGQFFLAGAGSDSLTWNGSALTIAGRINITGGNAATSESVLSAALNAVSTASNGDFTGTINGIPAITYTGRPNGMQLIRNAQFEETASTYHAVYDNNDSGTVTLTRQANLSSPTGYAPNASGFHLKIHSTTSATPGLGGFYQALLPTSGEPQPGYYRSGSLLIWKINAHIPVGYTIEFASNAYGTGGSFTWVTPHTGSGTWSTYIARQQIGASGLLASTGFWYLNGASTQDWYVASIEAFDLNAPAYNFNAIRGFTLPSITPTTPGLYMTSNVFGFHNGSGWRTYMDDGGKFFLAGSGSHQLSWNGSTLSIAGDITVTGGNAATSASVTTLSSSVATANPTAPIGLLKNAPSITEDGLFIGSTHMGYVVGGAWSTYIQNNGNFAFRGNGSNFIAWDGSTFQVKTSNIDINANNFRVAANSTGSFVSVGGAGSLKQQGFFVDSTGSFSISGSYGGIVVNRGLGNSGAGTAATQIYGGILLHSEMYQGSPVAYTQYSSTGISSPASIVSISPEILRYYYRIAAADTSNGLDGSSNFLYDGQIEIITAKKGTFHTTTQPTWTFISGALLPPADGTGIIGDATRTLTSVTAGAFYTTSTKAAKKNIVEYTSSAFDVLDRVNIVSFQYNNDVNEQPKIGFIAEDTPDILTGKDHVSHDHANSIGLLMKAVQELKSEIRELRGKLNASE